jgi:hypothetical protein
MARLPGLRPQDPSDNQSKSSGGAVVPIIRKGETAVITLPKWHDYILDRQKIKRLNLTPVIPRATAQSWGADKNLTRKPQYVFDADPTYKTTKLLPLISRNTIGYDENGDTIFVYLKKFKRKEVISRHLRRKALQGLLQMQFTPCARSGRWELRGAQAFNNRKIGTFAGEYNTGWMHLGGVFRIGLDPDRVRDAEKRKRAEHNDRLARKFVVPMLRRISDVFALALPKEFGSQNCKIKREHRYGDTTPFSTLTFLKSAPSAVHLDAKNGAGSLACMTTVGTSTRYTGGSFCLVQYGIEIKVQPGDLLIAATPYHWHANLSPVEGEKYSIICYFKDVLQRKRKVICAECGAEFLDRADRKKPRCPSCLANKGGRNVHGPTQPNP